MTNKVTINQETTPLQAKVKFIRYNQLVVPFIDGIGDMDLEGDLQKFQKQPSLISTHSSSRTLIQEP